MIYASQSDLESRFGGEIADFLAGNASCVSQALDDADAAIDGYLAGRYSLPLANVPAILTQYACDIARYRLYSDVAPDVVAARYKDAIAFLTRLSSGQISLGVSTPAPTGGPTYSATDRVFGADGLDGY